MNVVKRIQNILKSKEPNNNEGTKSEQLQFTSDEIHKVYFTGQALTLEVKKYILFEITPYLTCNLIKYRSVEYWTQMLMKFPGKEG